MSRPPVPGRTRALGGGVLALLLCLASVGAAGDELRYEVLMAGHPAGEQVVVRDGREIRAHFEYNDRGRGPSLDLAMRLDEHGIPVSLETTGENYLKAPVEERFELDGTTARWKNAGEDDSRELSGPALYASFEYPLQMELLAGALLQAPDRTLPLLPSGEARIRPVAELEVAAGGKRRTVRLVELSGIDFSPELFWLDEHGDLFAYASEWLSAIAAGWQDAIPELLARQKIRANERQAELVAKLAQHPQAGIAFTGTRLFDADSGVLRPGMTVLVQGNRIAAVGRDGSVRIPAGAEVIDGSGKTLLPGLWDMHVHMQSGADGLLHIASGVTTVRDMANDMDLLSELDHSFSTGAAIGPRILKAGIIDGRGPYAAPTKALVSTADEAREWVERYAEHGYPQIKIYSSVPVALVPVIVEAAKAHGMRVSGHIPAGMWAEDAVRAGYDEFQHINMFFLNFYKDVTETRTPARFTAVAERGADLDLASPEVRDFVELLRARRTVVDPTVTVFEGMFTDRPGEISPSYAGVADRLPPQVRRSMLAGGLPIADDAAADRYRRAFERMLDVIRDLEEHGVQLVAGTDSLPGFTLHRELELYVRAGIPAARVLQIATRDAARTMGRSSELGSIAPGKRADLVLVEGDPTQDISAIRNTDWVVKDGVLFDAAEVYSAVNVH